MATRELTDKQRHDAEMALHRGDPLPSGLAFGPRGIRRLSDDELKAAEDAAKAEMKRADEFAASDAEAVTSPGTVVMGTGNAV